MMHHLLLFVLFAASACASPFFLPPVYTSVPTPPAPWQKVHSHLSPTVLIPLRVALSLPKDTLHDLALNVNDPSRPSYGSHLSQSAISAILTPSTTSIDRVTSWLKLCGAENITLSSDSGNGGTWVDLHTSVGQANEFLNATFERFTHLPENANLDVSIIRSLTYSFPAELADLIDFIHPITHFPRIKHAKKKQQPPRSLKSFPPPRSLQSKKRATATNPLVPRASIPISCVGSMTPSCLTTLYNINYAAPVNEVSPSQIGIAGFLEQYPNRAFVADFLESYGIPANRTPVAFNVDWINFNNISSIPDIDNSTTGGAEAILDLEYNMAYTNPISVTYFYTAGRGPFVNASGMLQPSQSDNEPWLEFLEYYLSLANPPQVLSISYTDTEQTVPYPYASRICTLFAALAARGVSVIVAAGDAAVEGATSVPDDVCLSNDGEYTPRFLPTFPASCPYVTAVGATNLYPEVAASYTAGGFSNYFGVQDWQVNATSSYILGLNGTYDGLYNKSGRGIPDISAFGDRFLISYAGGATSHGSGTSASTPVIASMIALLNDERMRQGGNSLGWLNPLLYSTGLEQVWQDIVIGSNYGCGTIGFQAGPGWDAVSGLGSPRFDVLRDIIA